MLEEVSSLPSLCLGAMLFLLWVQMSLVAVDNDPPQWGDSGDNRDR